eukprot:SAG31_NODE_8136_length_1514_cov_1.440283_1_plen_112_part_00
MPLDAQAAEQIFGPILAELGGLLAAAQAETTHIDLASAEDGAALICRLAAGVHALSQTDDGAAIGRLLLVSSIDSVLPGMAVNSILTIHTTVRRAGPRFCKPQRRSGLILT